MATDKEILQEFHRVEEGSAIPADGACGFFYEAFSDAGTVLVLCGGPECAVFYLDHEDVVDSITGGDCGFYLEPGAAMIRLFLICDPAGAQFTIPMILRRGQPSHDRLLENIRETRRITFHYITLLAGCLYRRKSITFGLPGHIMDGLTRPSGPGHDPAPGA